MNRAIIFGVVVVLMSFGCRKKTTAVILVNTGHSTIQCDSDDFGLANAIENARSSVGYFVKELLASSADTDTKFAFLADVTEDDVRGYVWCALNRDFTARAADNKICGDIIETPREWKIIRPGQGMVADSNAVLDWRIIRNGEIEGAFTTRVMWRKMTAQQRDDLVRHLGAKFKDAP